MKKSKILLLLPYVLVIIIIGYLAVKYDALNKEENGSNEITITNNRELLKFSTGFEGDSQLSYLSSDSVKFEGNSSALITEDNLYGPTFSNDSISILKSVKKVEVNLMLFSPLFIKDAVLVISFENENGCVIYKASGLAADFKINQWNKINSKFEIDNLLLSNENKIVFKSYVLNSKKERLFIDNFEVKLFAK